MNNLCSLLASIILIGCSHSNNLSDEYILFKNKYKRNGYYHLETKRQAEEIYSNSDSLTLIDSVFLLPLKLVKTNKGVKDLGIDKLSEYNCRLISFTEDEKYDCVVTLSYTSNAGSGDPIFLVNTYDKAGKLLSQAKFNLIFRDDYSPIPRQYFSIDKKNIITMELVSENYEISDSLGHEVLKYINTDYSSEKYLISDEGLITKQ